jgi:hypothetical protein
MERLITLQWDKFVRQIDALPSPSPEREMNLITGEEFLHRILNEDLSAEYLLNLSDDTIQAAWEISFHDDADSDPLLDMAQMKVDPSAWEHMLRDLLHLDGICDPSVAEEFI